MLGEILDVLRVDSKIGIKGFFRDLIGVHRAYYTRHYLLSILAFLEERKIKATFFISAKKLKEEGETIRRIQYAGHEIASHGFNHLLLTRLSNKQLEREFSLSEKSFNEFGIRPKGFRPPFLAYNEGVLSMARKYGFSYVSTMEGGNIFKYDNGLIEVPIIKPYDWQGLIANALSIEQLIAKWKKRDGFVYLLHPWIFNYKKYNPHFIKILEPRKDYRIDCNLKKGSIALSFDIYFR